MSRTSLATPSSCDWMLRVMQYISLFRAGGWWLSWTEILGTLEMILNNKSNRDRYRCNLKNQNTCACVCACVCVRLRACERD